MAFRRKQTGNPEAPSRKSSPTIGFRASEAERAQIEVLADRAGLTPSSYVRSRALEKPTTRAVRRPPIATAQLAQLLGMLGALHGQMRETLDKHGGAIPTCDIEELMRMFREAGSAIMQTLGKRAVLTQDGAP